jgi:threonine synthase
MPVGSGQPPVTLGEGNTPVVEVDVPKGALHLKLEGSNPTGSHKDRAMAVGVTAAVEQGRSVVVVASSGNAGAAAAAYAARARLTCVVTTTRGLAPAIEAQILAAGAQLAYFPTSSDRTEMTRRAVEELGWFPLANYMLPAVGGNPFANEGYKSIAYELARDLPDTDFVVIPTCRADVLSGIARGYRELAAAQLVDRVPRLVAAETSTGAAFTVAMAVEERSKAERVEVVRTDSPAFSIGSDNANWQGLHSLWQTEGLAIAVPPEEYVHECARLAREEGLLVEISSAVAVRVARDLAERTGSRIVALATATGLKDSAWVAAGTTSAPLDSPTLDDLEGAGARDALRL